MGNIRNTRLPRPTTAQLARAAINRDSRRRIARQIAETTGLVTRYGDVVVGAGE